MDAATLKLAKNYTNEQVVQKATNSPVEEISFDGGICSVGNNVVNGQVSDVVIKGLTATNLVKNGSFENDNTGWTKIPSNVTAVTISTEKSYVGMNSVKQALVNQAVGPYQDIVNLVVGHKYYFSSVIYLSSYTSGSPRMRLNHNGGTSIYADTSKLNQWQRLSRVIENALPSESIKFEVPNLATFTAYIDAVMAIDLTVTFGAGNEPTKEQCDKIFPNWFDGTKSTNSVRVKSVGKNLFDRYSVPNSTIITAGNPTGLVRVFNLSEGLKIKGTLGGSGATFCVFKEEFPISLVGFPNSLSEDKRPNKPIVGAGTYIVSGSLSGSSKVYYDDTYAEPNTPFTANQGVWGLGVYRDAMVSTDLTLLWKLEQGSTATSYEPYKESIVNINLPEPLRSLPNGVKDEVRVAEGKAIKNVSDEYVLKETDVTSLITNWGTLWNFALVPVSIFDNFFNVNSTGGKIGMGGFRHVTSTSYAPDTLNQHDIVYSSNYSTSSICFALPKTVTDLTGAKTYLANHALTYQLATPIVTDIPKQKLEVFENGTVYVEPIGDASESTLPSVEMTIPTGTSNKFGVATHDYDRAAADWTLTNSESKCFLLA
ncbi:MAG: hypothetical protein PHE03_11715, partial [Bacteroidales bacterium]|nr:hypothetical protein [Bacteroidales bacterium]